MRTILLLISFWLLATPVSATVASYGKTECLRQAPECDLTVSTVLAEPNRFAGSVVQVRGYVLGDWEGAMIFASLPDCQGLAAAGEGVLGLGRMKFPMDLSDFSNWPCRAAVVEGVFFPQEGRPSDGHLVICVWCHDGYLEDIRYIGVD
jgi:hypothetical protein